MLIAAIIHYPCAAQVIITRSARFNPNCPLASSPLRRPSPFVGARTPPSSSSQSDHHPVLTPAHQHPLCDQNEPSGRDFVWPKGDCWPWPIGTNWDQLETLEATRRQLIEVFSCLSSVNITTIISLLQLAHLIVINYLSLKCWKGNTIDSIITTNSR